MMNKGLLNLLSFLVIGFLPYLINIFMLPFYSKFLDERDFGIIGLAMAFLLISSSWSNLQLPGAISRIYFDYSGIRLASFISTLINSSILVCVIFCFFYLVASDFLVNIIYGQPKFYWVHVLTVSCLFLSCTNTAFERLMIAQQRGSALLLRSILAQFFSVASGLYFICYLQLGVVGFMVSQNIYFLCILIFSILLAKNNYVFVLERQYLLEGIKYSYPLIFHALGGVVFMYSGAFFIKSLVGITALGVFTVADRFSQIPKAVIGSFNNVYSPMYNKIYKNGGAVAKFSSSAQKFFSTIFAVFSSYFVFVAAAFVNEYMIGEYGEVESILLILVPAYFFRSMFCFSSAPIFYHKDTHYVPIITCLSGLVIVLLSYPIISIFGVLGAASLVASGFLFTFILSELISRRKYIIYTFKKESFFSFSIVYIFNVSFMHYLSIDSFIALSMFSVLAATLNLIVFYYFNLFGFKDSIMYLRCIND
ncbi:lipopolysaccharide biosynthesis protein [Marinomonas lutimaris]|uniref:lipopolysaccharide biosynthesis protein n=1 Tax=Marinomonas lutimaris TaxID=2846746 RepID=UPI001CA544D7|nr:oligosaccharide flippase family protein [Marinomonas lutimaris]